MFQATAIEKEKLETFKNQMIAASFTAWQLGAGEKGKSFSYHLKKHGLLEKKEKITTQQKKVLAEQSKRIAERIMAMDRAKPRVKAKKK